MVRHRSAKPSTPVQFRPPPPNKKGIKDLFFIWIVVVEDCNRVRSTSRFTKKPGGLFSVTKGNRERKRAARRMRRRSHSGRHLHESFRYLMSVEGGIPKTRQCYPVFLPSKSITNSDSSLANFRKHILIKV